MTVEELHILLIIGVTLVIGICIGFIASILIVGKEAKHLNEELDKFRTLYFHEVDKWKNKYTSSHENRH